MPIQNKYLLDKGLQYEPEASKNYIPPQKSWHGTMDIKDQNCLHPPVKASTRQRNNGGREERATFL